MLTIKEETFEGTYPFAPRYYVNRNFEMHFVDEGQGEPVVLLHGDPTWDTCTATSFRLWLGSIVALSPIR
ncbi:hypothetical protein KSC_106610 [Ktedonobacter sp. SOSP1-52]|nr:hypothetical protein KSC_106610 [Ktedonobacter sp. SOSP1-52]